MEDVNRPDILEFINDKQKTAHLIGIGGVSMCSLAETLLESGHKITGSDMQNGSATKSLSKRKVKIFIGHFAENVRDADYIIRSAAIKDDNPRNCRGTTARYSRLFEGRGLGSSYAAV